MSDPTTAPRSPPQPSRTRPHWLPWIPMIGAFGGLIQALPVRGAVGCCCAPWLVIAGAAAVFAIVRQARARMEPPEGALVGLTTGIVAGIVGGVVAALREMLFSSTGFIRPFVLGERELEASAIVGFLWSGAVMLILYVVFGPILGALGGLVGAAVVKPPAEPAPLASAPLPPTRPPPPPG